MNGFTDFMGYRYMAIEGIIDDCLSAIRRGETEIVISRGDLTQSEFEYVQKEVDRRLNG